MIDYTAKKMKRASNRRIRSSSVNLAVGNLLAPVPSINEDAGHRHSKEKRPRTRLRSGVSKRSLKRERSRQVRARRILIVGIDLGRIIEAHISPAAINREADQSTAIVSGGCRIPQSRMTVFVVVIETK